MPKAQTIHKFGMMDRDTPFNQRVPNQYWDAHDIQLVNNGSTKAVTKHNGFDLKFELPVITKYGGKYSNARLEWVDPISNTKFNKEIFGKTFPNANTVVYDDWKIVGMSELNDDVVIMAVSDELTAIYTYDEGVNLHLKYCNILGMNQDNIVSIVANHENTIIQKIYWADGRNQLRHLNMSETELSKLDPLLLDLVTPVSFSEPYLVEAMESSGSEFLPGRIQYAYSLYNKNGAASALSTVSPMYDIVDPATGRGAIDVTGTTEPIKYVPVRFEMAINNIDLNFKYIKIYAIQYQKLNDSPSVRVIIDELISDHTQYIFRDSGNQTLVPITLEELIALGGKHITPKHIATKENRLFMANYGVKDTVIEFDARAFKYLAYDSETMLLTDASMKTADGKRISSVDTMPDEDHNCITPKPNARGEAYGYIRKTNNLGAVGKNVKLEMLELPTESVHTPPPDCQLNPNFDPSFPDDPIKGPEIICTPGITTTVKRTRTFKKGETYRFGVEFYNEYGGKSDVKWITDYKFPYTGTSDTVFVAKLTMTTAGLAALGKQGVIGYKLLYVERDPLNQTIVAQGIVNPMFKHKHGSKFGKYTYPYPMLKDITTQAGANISVSYNNRVDHRPNGLRENFWHVKSKQSTNTVVLQDDVAAFLTPDITFGMNIGMSTTLRPIGVATLNQDKTWSHKAWQPSGGTSHNKPEATAGLYFYGSGGGNETWDSYMGPTDNGDDSNTSAIYFGFNRVYDKVDYITRADIELEESPFVIDPGRDKKVGSHSVSSKISINKYTGKGYSNWDEHSFKERSLRTAFSPFLALNFKDPHWSKTAVKAGRYSLFADPTDERKIPIAELVRELDNQYGGPRYVDRQRNEYIACGPYTTLVNNDNGSNGLGDTYLSMFKVIRNYSSDPTMVDKSKADAIYHDEWVSVVLESNINIATRYDDFTDEEFSERYDRSDPNINLVPAHPYDSSYANVNDYKAMMGYNTAYSQNDITFKSYSLPPGFQSVNSYPTTILGSEKKINNEKIDNWLNFKSGNILTIDSAHGQIESLFKTKDQLLAFQRKAIAYISVSPTAQTSMVGGGAIVLGKGSPLDGYKYLTTTSGSVHPLSIVNDKSRTYYFDYDSKSINVIGDPEQEISTVTGMNQFLWDYMYDHPDLYSKFNDDYKHKVIFNYDNHSENVYFTFKPDGVDEAMTMSYNTMLNAMICFHHFKPDLYMTYRGHMHIGTRNSFSKITYKKYLDKDGNPYLFNITLLNTENPIYVKRYDNLELDSSTVFEKMRCTNSYQDTGEIDYTPTLKGLRSRSVIPRNAGTRHRMRDDHMYVSISSLNELPVNIEYAKISYVINKTDYVAEK